MVESSNKTWYTGEGSGKPFQYYCFKNHYLPLKRQIDMKLEDEPPSSVGVQYATGGRMEINIPRKNEKAEPK